MVACNQSEAKKAVEKKAPKEYDLGEVIDKQLSSSINLPGEIKPFEIVQLYPKVNGFVEDVLVDRGSKVKKGQILLKLEAPEIEQQYFAAKSKYLQATAMYVASKDNYERLLATSKTPGTVSAHDITIAKSRMMADSAIVQGEIANYSGLEVTKNYLIVRATFDGVITERNVHPGALVGPNLKTDDKPMLVLQQEEKLRLIINIPEVYSNQLASNSIIAFHVSTLPGKYFKGVINRSAGALDMKYRSEAMEIDVNNKERLLKPGMYAEVELPVKRIGPSPVVPKSSIVNSTEGKYVICVRNGKTHKVNVQEGNFQNDSTEVFGELKAGDKIIINATDDIKEGIAIK